MTSFLFIIFTKKYMQTYFSLCPFKKKKKTLVVLQKLLKLSSAVIFVKLGILELTSAIFYCIWLYISELISTGVILEIISRRLNL